MRQLLTAWFYIAFLMARPSDHPGDSLSLRTALLAAVFSYVLAITSVVGISLAVVYALLDIGFAAGSLWVALRLAQKTNRFVQAFASYCGASSILNLASIFMLRADAGVAESAQGLSLPVVIYFVYLVWGISMVAHIIRHTFEVSLPVGVLAATGYLMVTMTLVDLFIG